MSNVKILLVEDENIEAMDIKRTLESFGYEVPYVALSGEEAVEKALEMMPDLILMDINLKGDFDGVDAVSNIKDQNIFVIYLTADSEKSIIQRAKHTEPYGYITISYNHTELKYAIELAFYKNQIGKKLKESEKKFYLLFENSPLPYQSLDGNGLLLDVNPAWLDILGYSKDEVIGENFADFIAPGYADHFKKNFPHFKDAGEIHGVEFEMKRKDGSHIIVSYEGKIGYDELGNFKQTHCIFHDITKRKNAEKALKASENKYQAIFDNAGDGILLMRGELIIECNEKSLEIYKVTREQIINKRPFDFSPELQPDGTRSDDKAIELINKALDGYPQHFNWKHLRYDGIPFYCEINLNRVKIENEYLIQAMVRDVTEREEAKKVLRESEQRLTDIINFLPYATFVIDIDGNVIAWNDAIERMTGTLKEDIIGKGDHAYSIPLYGERRPILIDLIKSGTSEFCEKYEYIHKQGKSLYAEVFVPSVYDGRGAYLLVTASPLLNSEGEHYGAIESIQDITERKKAETSLKKSEERFRTVAESAIDAIVTTDENGKIIFFNNSLTKIFGYTKEDLNGKPLTLLMPTRYHKNYLIALQNFKKIGKHRIIGKTVTTIGLKKDKSEFPFEMSLSAWKSEEKTYFTSIIRDLSERKKSEIALKESEKKFRAIAENAFDAILISVEKGKHVYVNPKAVELTGYSKEELLNTKIEDLAHPDEIDNLMKRYDQRIAGKKIPPTYETRIVRKDNKIVPIEISSAKTIWKDKPAVMVQVRDITSRKKIEEKLKLASSYNRSLIEASLDPLVIIGPDGKVTDVNKATETVTGYPRDKIIGSDFSNFFTEPLKAEIGYKKVFNEGFVKDYSLEIQHRNGYKTPVLYNASVYKDEAGEVVGVFAAARDISRIIEAEKNIRMLANVVESTDDAIITMSLEGIVLSWNKGAAQIYGYSSEEVMGKNISILVPDNLRNELTDLIENIKQGQKLQHYETLRLKKNGQLINASITLSPVYDTSGKLIAISTIARDISIEKKSEEMLKKSLGEKEVLLREIHHRVKNNLQIIASLLNLQECNENEEIGHILKESMGRVKTMATIHEKLYESPSFNDINFKEFTEKLLYDILYTYGVPRGSIKTILNIEDINLNIDTAVPLGLIINELVTNSIKYAFPKSKGTITIKLKSLPKEMELIVADDGIGFSEDKYSKNKADTLGFRLVKGLIEQIEGTIKLDRSHGTTFKITFNELKYKDRI